MKLNAAEDLKEEVLSELALRLRKRGGEEPSVAVGIAPGAAGSYRIAVRPRLASDLADVHEYLQETTAGELEIRITGPITPLGSPMAHGASISRAAGGPTGSVGFFARRHVDDAIGFISNNHILAAEDVGKDGDGIIHPGRTDKRRGTPRIVGYLDGSYPPLHPLRREPVDCAFARLAEAVTFDAERLGDPVPASSDIAVRKVGRSTGWTEGRVTAFALDRCRVDYASGAVTFRGQIEIESTSGGPFSTPGDSGSLIVTEDLHPLGLLYSCSAAGGTFNSGLTYANPIRAILDALGVSIVT